MTDFAKLKMPKWMPGEPAMWFSLCERKMKMAGLLPTAEGAQDNMFTLVACEIPESVQVTVKKQIASPHLKHEYDDLKAAVLGKDQESPEEAFLSFRDTKL